MPNKLPSFKSSKSVRFFYALLIVLATFGAFYLDILTKDVIAFDAFYLPSIMIATWLFGGRVGCLMAVLTGTMWFLAAEDAGSWQNAYLLIDDWIVHIVVFSIVCGMTALIRKKTEQLTETSNELARSNLELEQFAARAAHDLQAPLATILGYTELLKEKYGKTGDAETLDFTGHVIHSVKRMTSFIKALLNYSNVRKSEVPVSLVALEKIVKEVIEDFHFALLEKKAEIICDPLPVLPVNPGLAGLLFQNLIGNAMKYCEKEPRIHISAVRKGKEWLFSVHDNGIGIPEESRERIFVMFEKLPTRRQYPGSGIGLATCQKIVERFGGRIWVESKVGEGSTFFFTLPAA